MMKNDDYCYNEEVSNGEMDIQPIMTDLVALMDPRMDEALEL